MGLLISPEAWIAFATRDAPELVLAWIVGLVKPLFTVPGQGSRAAT